MRPLMSSSLPAPSTNVVSSFLTHYLAATAEVVERGGVEFSADLFAQDRAARQDSDVLQHGLSAVAKAGSL